jgi:hypothetical protein
MRCIKCKNPDCRPKGVCLANGDPHQYPFDGSMYSFQGGCNYTYVETCGKEVPVWFKLTARHQIYGAIAVIQVSMLRNFFSSSLITGPNKVEHLFLASLSSLAYPRGENIKGTDPSHSFGLVVSGKEKRVWKPLIQEMDLETTSCRIHVDETLQVTVSNGTTCFKNVNSCLNTNIYSHVETSGGQSYNLYLNVLHFFNTRVN